MIRPILCHFVKMILRRDVSIVDWPTVENFGEETGQTEDNIHYLPNELSNDLFIRPAWKNTFPLHVLWKLRVWTKTVSAETAFQPRYDTSFDPWSSRRRGGGVCFLVWTAGVAASRNVASRRCLRDARHPRSFPRLCVPPFPCHLRFWERDRRSDHVVQAQEILDFSGGE